VYEFQVSSLASSESNLFKRESFAEFCVKALSLTKLFGKRDAKPEGKAKVKRQKAKEKNNSSRVARPHFCLFTSFVRLRSRFRSLKLPSRP
jgi:hypothetical protein